LEIASSYNLLNAELMNWITQLKFSVRQIVQGAMRNYKQRRLRRYFTT